MGLTICCVYLKNVREHTIHESNVYGFTIRTIILDLPERPILHPCHVHAHYITLSETTSLTPVNLVFTTAVKVFFAPLYLNGNAGQEVNVSEKTYICIQTI